MNGRRAALLLVIVLGSLAMLWAASTYSRQVAARRTAGSEPASAGAETGGPATIRFFKNPASAPVFTARDLDGREISTASLRGKVVILNFWATWCPPCRAEIPDLIALQDKYRDQIQIIGISEDEAPVEVVKRFATDHRMNFPTVMSTPDIEKMFPSVSALPTSFIVNRESRVVMRHVGMLTPATTEAETRHLAGMPVNVDIEEIDKDKVPPPTKLANAAQTTEIPGVDLKSLPKEKRIAAIQKLNDEGCTCGCNLTVARCRVDDPSCPVSLPRAKELVASIAN